MLNTHATKRHYTLHLIRIRPGKRLNDRKQPSWGLTLNNTLLATFDNKTFAKQIQTSFKAKLLLRLKTKTPPCHCPAYSFPHRYSIKHGCSDQLYCTCSNSNPARNQATAFHFYPNPLCKIHGNP